MHTPTLQMDLSRVSLKRRRTKIVATIGPSSSSPEVLQRLLAAGVDVVRMNFSHGTHEQHGEAYRNIRAAAATCGHHVAVLADLCGPKIRVGMFEGGAIELVPGETVTVTVRDVLGGKGLIPSQYVSLARDVKGGDRILLDDGKLALSVIEVEGTEISCLVVDGGRLSNKKGMNLPGVAVSTPALTDKDRLDAAFASRLGVDYLALSFVRGAADVEDLKFLLNGLGLDTPIIAKIEKPEALSAIGQILGAADGIMVARGDLGVEVAAEEVPLIQQELIRLATLANKPVIVATQMLESMIESARPTRAEVTDVAQAAMARADAVMLSAETAAGKHPVEAVATMDRILRMVEGYQFKHSQWGVAATGEQGRLDSDSGEAISRATSLLSHELSARAIVVPTRSGKTVRLVSAERPAAPIIATTRDEQLCRRLALLWGVTPEHATLEQAAEPGLHAQEVVRRMELGERGQTFLLVWEATPDRGQSSPTVSILRI